MNDVEKLQADLTAERGRRIVAEDLERQAKIDATYWEGRAKRADRVWPKLVEALQGFLWLEEAGYCHPENDAGRKLALAVGKAKGVIKEVRGG